MKVSDLITSIVETAEAKFGVSNHNNDCINVGIYISQQGKFQVYLERPTHDHLGLGESNCYGLEVAQLLSIFFTESNSLVGALSKLQAKVLNAEDDEFYA